MKKYIPQPLKYTLIALYIFCKCLLRGNPYPDITLNLAGVLPEHGSKKIIHGGKVKLLALREKFGDSWKKFNIAYFVSSGLPFAPTIWIRIYKLFGVRVVWNQNGFAYPALYPKKIVERVNALMKPMFLADYLVYQTEFTKRCAEKFVGEFIGPYEILINPIDTSKFKPSGNSLPNEPLTIIMSGTHFESEERVQVSLEALRYTRARVPLKLIIIGKPDFEIDEEWVEKIGAFSQAEAPELYRRAHLLLHLKYLDPCPTIVLEALASGLPVVGQRNGGMPELVDTESGILIDVPEDFYKLHYPDPKVVANAILRIKESLPSYSKAAREQALKFDKERWLKKHEEIFARLLK